MEKECSDSDCIAPERKCIKGLEFKECPNFGERSVVSKKQINRTSDGTLISWSGIPLGLEDLNLIAGRGRPCVVGTLGPHQAGKTTLLSILYSHLWHGKRLGEAQFAGSYSFAGWENITVPLRWNEETNPPQFPPHTALTEERVPGLLHLALRHSDGMLEDWLFTDAPGEWFKRWSLNENAPEAQSVRWIAENSTIFVLVIDCDILSGYDRGKARIAYQNLISRLSSVQRNRPVAVVWSKIDGLQGEEKIAVLKQYLSKVLKNYEEFKVSTIRDGEKFGPTSAEFERLFNWLNTARIEVPLIQPEPVFSQNDMMLSFRG